LGKRQFIREKIAMKAKGFLNFSIFYYTLLLLILTMLNTIGRGYFLEHQILSISICGVLLLPPFIIWIVVKKRPSFAKRFRVFLSQVFHVKTFAVTSLIVLVAFSISFIYNVLILGFSTQYISFNIIALNFIFLFFILLVLDGRFQIDEPKGLLIQETAKPEVYLYRKGELRHIPDEPTLLLLGYSFDDVQEIPKEEFAMYQVRQPALDSVKTAKLIRGNERPEEIYMILEGKKRKVPDEITLINIQRDHDVEDLPQEDVDNYHTGDPLTSVLKIRS